MWPGSFAGGGVAPLAIMLQLVAQYFTTPCSGFAAATGAPRCSCDGGPDRPASHRRTRA
jgi:hypothetical protein